MKALTIKQPWASLIAHGIKDIENRTWKTNFRGRIFIHASAKPAGSTLNLLNQEQQRKWESHLYTLDRLPGYPESAIIGEVDIVDCVINHSSIWAEKTHYPVNPAEHPIKPIFNWVLANPVLYDKPILNVKGKLSFWEFNPYEGKDNVLPPIGSFCSFYDN